MSKMFEKQKIRRCFVLRRIVAACVTAVILFFVCSCAPAGQGSLYSTDSTSSMETAEAGQDQRNGSAAAGSGKENSPETGAGGATAGSGKGNGLSAEAGGHSRGAYSGKLPDDKEISAALTFESEELLDYAECFSLFRYEGGYTLINLCDGSRYLTVPEGQPVPPDLSSDITVLRQPVCRIYLAASASMDMFVKSNALDCISLSGMEAEKWMIPKAREAMEKGDILYAGKYSTPDYELILSRGCDLAVENTMIFHSPQVREQLIRTGVPVLVDHASYETHPLGRTEWVKLYGVLTGHEQEADEAFQQQKSVFDAVLSQIDDGQEARNSAFFSVNAVGAVTVRKSTDYVPAMIRLAGGRYLPEDLSDGKLTSTATMQMEEFCQRASGADCLIYNGTIEGEINSIDELLRKAPALKTFKAVKQGHVWCTSRNLYQDSMETGTIIADFHRILTDPDSDGSELSYLHKLEER